PENLKIDANSMILFEDISIEMKSQSEMVIKVEKAITIYNKLADHYADVSVHYDKRKSIRSISAYIYDVFGNEEKKIRRSDFKDYSAYDGISLHNDGRLLHYDYTPTSYPYTIYYKYEVKTSNTAFINRWIPISGYFQSIQNSKFTIKYPLDVTLRKSEKNFNNLPIKIKEIHGLLSYEISEIPAIKYESYAPLFFNIVPNVKLGVNKFNLEGVDGEANNWSEFGKWYYDNLIESTLDLQEATKRKIKDLTSNVSEPIEKAKIVYEYVQNKVRYISVQVGIGGFKPMQANDVDNLGYGDCKALTNYTAALLKEVGIPSYHTLIHADNKIDFDEKVASPEGNHMILYVPISNQDIWLECTSQKNPFSEIGDFTDDRDALIVTPEGGIIKHTKIYKTEENLQFTKGSYSIDNLGTITAQVIIESSGTQYGDNLQKYDGESPKELDVLFKKYLSNINNIKFSKIEVFNNKKDFKYEETLEFSASNYSSTIGDQLLIPINAFNKNTDVPKRIRNRKLPFEISSGFIDIDEIEIKLPVLYSVEYIPENIELKSEFGLYTITFTKVVQNTYIYKRTLKIDKCKFPKENYEAYRSFKKDIQKYDNLKIILKKIN
uniref:DUF3857 domain-containing protein n=1 Tax=Lutibacter sp. TaxID=1925666 RepID=UPI0035678271